MKQLTVTGNLLKGLVLAALLTGCQNDDVATHNSQTDAAAHDRNAKTIFTPQLLKEGANELEYYGDYDLNRGKLKKLTNMPEGAYTEYQWANYRSATPQDFNKRACLSDHLPVGRFRPVHRKPQHRNK